MFSARKVTAVATKPTKTRSAKTKSAAKTIIAASVLAASLPTLAETQKTAASSAAESAAHSDSISNDLISTAPADAVAYFISPRDGDKVNRRFIVRFGLKGMGVAPAGAKIENTGHHHLVIDTELDEIDLTKSLPADETVLHFGKGQTEAEIKLAPGMHTLQMVLGNFAHIPHQEPVVSEQITILVE